MFTHVWRGPCEPEPWIVTDADDATTAKDLRSFMLNTRYWWLEGAPDGLDPGRGIDAVFDKYDIETIAPGYGCVLRGRKVVARHYRMLDEFLAACDKSVAVSALRQPRRGALSMAHKMPREISRPVCSGSAIAWRRRHKGKSYHGYNAAFVVAGETASCLVETGHPERLSGDRAAHERAVSRKASHR